jgi:hypothetical protein
MILPRNATVKFVEASLRRSTVATSSLWSLTAAASGRCGSRSMSTSKDNPFAWSESDREKWLAQGIIDERNLVQFDTLHNMQIRSCQVFAPKPLFATYSPETKNFEWMTFAECKFSRNVRMQRFCDSACVTCDNLRVNWGVNTPVGYRYFPEMQ